MVAKVQVMEIIPLLT